MDRKIWCRDQDTSHDMFNIDQYNYQHMMKSVNTFGEVSVFSFGPVISSSNSLKINTFMVY